MSHRIVVSGDINPIFNRYSVACNNSNRLLQFLQGIII